MKTVLSGIVTGGIVKILTGDLWAAILTATCTGAAAYIGQQVMKFLYHTKLYKDLILFFKKVIEKL